MSRRSWVILIIAAVVLVQLLLAGYAVKSQKAAIFTFPKPLQSSQ